MAHLARRVVSALAFVSAVVGILFAGPTLQPLSAHADAIAPDPTVIIAVDVTNEGRGCQEVWHLNIRPHFPSQIHGTVAKPIIWQGACPAGTIVASKRVRRSQALAAHEPFVLVLAPTATTRAQQEAKEQVAALLEAKSQELLTSAPKQPVIESTCGYDNVKSLDWLPTSGYEYYSSIQYYRVLSCTYVNLQTSYINVDQSQACMHWDFDDYGAGYWYNNAYPCLQQYGAYQFNPSNDRTHTAGLYYEQYLDAPNGSTYHDDLGPCN